MIITRTPFRITLGGGGTDLPSFYGEHGGFVLAAGINKYMYVNINTPIVDDLVRIRYSSSETVENVSDVRHTLARSALESFGIENGIEIDSIADIPAGTGLGSSSCYLVGLLNGLHTLTRTHIGPQNLAEEACEIELNMLQKPIGKQDQYMAAFGGLTVLNIAKNGTVTPQYLPMSVDLIEELERNLLLFFTGGLRDATAILKEQDGATKRKEHSVVSSLTEIMDIGKSIAANIMAGNLAEFGKLMDYHWKLKKRLSSGITNPMIDAWYDLAKQSGAIGGKITGAGGGGFLMLYCEGRKAEVREAMINSGLRELKFHFEFEGSKVIFDVTSRDGRLAHQRRQQVISESVDFESRQKTVRVKPPCGKASQILRVNGMENPQVHTDL